MLLLSVLMVLTARAPSQAQGTPTPAADADRTEEAKALFAAGRAAFDAGRYADALDYFERAYAISKRPGLLYNIGITHDRARNDERAVEAYEAYLSALPEADNRTEVETRAAAIRAALATRRSQQDAAVAATPAQAAATMQPAPSSYLNAAIETDTSEPRGSSSILERWWFWTAVGVVVAGGVTIGVVAASGDDADPPSPLPPKGGVVVTTLGVAP
jgi:tetratricopeptide (TPR) repeat protein